MEPFVNMIIGNHSLVVFFKKGSNTYFSITNSFHVAMGLYSCDRWQKTPSCDNIGDLLGCCLMCHLFCSYNIFEIICDLSLKRCKEKWKHLFNMIIVNHSVCDRFLKKGSYTYLTMIIRKPNENWKHKQMNVNWKLNGGVKVAGQANQQIFASKIVSLIISFSFICLQFKQWNSNLYVPWSASG